MKSNSRSFILIASLLLAQSAWADVVQSNNLVNLREEPAADSTVAGQVKNGDIIDAKAPDKNGWSEVNYNGKTVYIKARFVKKQSEVAPAKVPPTESAQPETTVAPAKTAAPKTEVPAAVEAPAQAPVSYAKVSIDGHLGANLRMSATMSSELMDIVPDSGKVKVTGAPVNGWVPVEYKGQQGYIYNDKGDGNVLHEVKDVPMPPVKPEDAKTEAAHVDPDCETCKPKKQKAKLHKIPKEKIVYKNDDTCYGRALLQAAIRGQATAMYLGKRGAHPYSSGGRCAEGVYGFIKSAGFIGHGYDGHAGDAIDYWRRPHQKFGNLDEMGMENMIGKYTAENAPPGAVLVFRGPLTSNYERTGHYPPLGARGGYTAGDWVGHITVKGEGTRSYYTDGHTIRPAIDHRTLVGVYVMHECKTCTPALQRKCAKSERAPEPAADEGAN